MLLLLAPMLWGQQVIQPGEPLPDDSIMQPQDSAIMAPVAVRRTRTNNYEDLIRPASNLDLPDPDNMRTEVVYQPESGYYVIHTKVGDVDIATPYLLTDQEYQRYSEQVQMHQYWRQKISEVEHNNERKFDITDMKFNIGPADRVFGPGGVQLKLQGSAELLFGFNHQYINNPSLNERSRNNNIFNFDEKIQVNVTGKVGEKLEFKMNYNTEASFSQDQQNLKLQYKGQEDDIIQSIEAGNVTMDLNSSLIRGTQALFGFKTTLKFGKFKIQGLISQQNSQSQSVSSKGGTQTTKFDIGVDEYDENRHFFLGYYFRDNYERALSNPPYISSGVTINRIEVWVTNRRGNYDQARNIVACVDLGEASQSHIHSPQWAANGQRMPQNRANNLYDELVNNAEYRNIQTAGSALQAKMEGGMDYEKLESARLLSSSEYTLNAALGYISLKTALQQDEVLAVAYEYTAGGQVYQVGEFSTDNSDESKAPNCLFLKLLKSTANAPDRKGTGTWDLMMKNVYWLGANSINSDKFELYVQYRNDSVGTQVQYLSEGDCAGKQLLRVLRLDRMDSKNNPNPDGKFDFVENQTVMSSTGRIIFPVLEPFGQYMDSVIGKGTTIAKKYAFTELYDSTLVTAQEYSEKNKFRLTGKYKGSASSNEIRLNAMNIPRGSVTVTAGGATLVENVDYTVDYMMGTVTILNESIISSGTNVDVKLENQSTFSMKRKALYGAHLEYEFSKDFVIGGTIMHLREKPLTTKVNSGSEPLANTIWGVNLNYKTEMQWLTNAIDRIPWINATQPSTLQVGAEFAHLIPGHTNDVGSAGTSYIDDFEATTTGIDVHYPNYWFLASTPRNESPKETHLKGKAFLTDDSKRSNSAAYNSHRALMSWYIVDPIFGYPQSNTPEHIKNDPNAMSDHRSRIIYSQELFPNKEQLANEDTKLGALNISYYPEERGPYNISAGRFNADGKLKDPESNWGGMMRRLDNTDFEKSNIEYIEFWMMDPKHTNQNGEYEGDLYINLGEVSEDILRDGKKSFEHGLPVADGQESMIDTTLWGRVPRTTSTVVAFSNEAGARERQDVGLDGLSNQQERTFSYNGKRPYGDFVDSLRTIVSQSVLDRWRNDPFSPTNDPAGDNYHYYRGSDWDRQEKSVMDRYKYYNGTEGNSPDSNNQGEDYGTAATLTPDIEDINADNTINEYEKYFQYHVSLRKEDLEPGKQHITERLTSKVTLRNGQTEDVTWYQFKIPLQGDSATVEKVGNIRNFKSIRFMRIYMTGCKKETHLRFATMNLVRGEWRQYTKDLAPIGIVPATRASLDVQAVSIEGNGMRTPINYILPPGVSRQTDPGQAQLIAQNEQAMVLKVRNLSPKDAKAVYKNTSYDLRNYKKLQMFVHAERLPDDVMLQDNDLTCFIRMGTDLKYNYYEYEIPLRLTDPGRYNNDNDADRWKVWPRENYFDFPFSVFTKAKVARNKAKRSGTQGVSLTTPYTIYDDENGKPNNKVTVIGNPTLEDVSSIMIGVRNNGTGIVEGEVWVNELRLSEFNEQGGVAAMANVALGISDIAQFNVSGRLETAGYGSIENNVLDRNMDNQYNLAVSAAMEVGRLFPEKAKLQIPVYASYSNETTTPEYDPYDTDVKLKESLSTYTEKSQKDSLKQLTNTVYESTSFSVTNMKVNIKSKKKDMFYDPANFAISASYNSQKMHNPEIEKEVTTDHRGSFNYSYSFNPQPWEPFKNVEKVSKLKFIKELNIYYLPQSWAFNMNMHRTFSHMKMRDLTGSAGKMDLTASKDFTWDRNVDFKYDLTRNMKFSLQTAHNATIDEGLYAKEIIKDYHFSNDYYEAWKDTIQRSLKQFGKPYTYQQVFTASWNVPFNRVPYLEAVSANATYSANYNWTRTAASNSAAEDSQRGNTVSSVQTWQIDGGINFETLYGKSKYWKQITQQYGGRQRARAFRPKTFSQTIALKKGVPQTITHRLGSEMLIVLATDSTGKKVPVQFRADGPTKVVITSQRDCEAVTLAISTRDPNKRTPAQIAMDMGAYFGTLLRKIQVTYRETNSMTVPGFYPEPVFMGQKGSSGGMAPGLDFTFGFIPSNFIEKAKENGWLSRDTSVVQPATRAHTSDLDIRINLEPLPGFKIQLNGKRYNASSTSIIYSYDRLQENTTGSFNITQVAIGTIFSRIGNQEENFSNTTYDQFVENIGVMRDRVERRYEGIAYPDAGFLRGTGYPSQRYSSASGQRVSRTSADVLVPAFLSAYTGRDINKADFNPFLSVLRVLPNWSVTFDGLGKLPWIKDHFRSVTLTHAYTCKYAIGSYGTFSTWVPADGNDKTIGFVRNGTTDGPAPSSSYDISNVTLAEAFSPLIGLNLTMKNSLSIKAEYRKQRNLALNVTSAQLTEGHSNEFVIGAGYTIKNLNFVAKKRDGGQKKVSNDLKLNVDVSYKDVKSLLRKIEENITQASSGNKVFAIKISADYVLSQKVNIQLFYDHQGTTPLISSSYPVKTDNVGINIKLMLTR